MPKTPSNKLFRLIKSLSGSEKRYFKLFINSGNSKSNKYIQLFDAIDLQEEFDEEKLKQSIYADEPIQSRKYSELKAYLYDTILRSLQFYDEKTAIDFKLNGMLQNIRVLFKRSLFEDCLDMLQKLKKLALKYEKFGVILEVLDWEKQIAYTRTDITYLDKELDRINEEERFASAQIDNIISYRNVFFQLLIQLRKGRSIRLGSQKEKLKAMIGPTLFENKENIKTHKALILYYRVHANYYYAIADFHNFHSSSKELIELIESKPYLLKEEQAEYISAISNFALSCIVLKEYAILKKTIEKFKKVNPITKDDELKIHRQYYTFNFRLCIDTGEFQEGEKALEEHLLKVKKFDASLFEKSTFYFQYFYIYFGAGNYDKALEHLNNWLSMSKSIERKDLQSLARILNLLIHFEMGNSLLVDSLLRNTQRFLSKEKIFFEFENSFVRFIKEANKNLSKKELKQLCINLKEDLKRIAQIPEEKAMLQLFDIEAWLESKIEQKLFAQIVKQKYQMNETLT